MSNARRFGGAGIRRGIRSGGGGLPQIALAYDWQAGAGVADDGSGPPPGVDTWTDQEAGLALADAIGKPDLIATDSDFGNLESVAFGTGGTEILRDSAPNVALAFLHSGAGMTMLLDLFVETTQSGTGTFVETNNSSSTGLGMMLRYEATGSVARLLVGNGSSNVIDLSGAISKGARHRMMVRFSSTAFDSDSDSRIADMWVDGTRVASQATVSNAAAGGAALDKLAIGNRSTSANTQLDGKIRRVSLASAIATAAQWDLWRATA